MARTVARTVVFRTALVLGGAVLALGVGELAMRMAHSRLPSTAGLDGLDPRDHGEFQRWTDPVPAPDDCWAPKGTHRPAHRPKREQHGTGPSRALWVVGDSLVQGWGVAQGAAWPQLLAEGLAVPPLSISLTRLGSPGLGYCGWLADLHHALDSATPDLVVMQLFADDLERRDMVLVHGRVVAMPQAPVLRASWLLNRLWFAWATHRGGALPERDSDAVGQERFASAISAMVHRLDDNGVPWAIVLVPPAGMERCASQPEVWGDCDWLAADQDLMADLLNTANLPFVDLRALWSTVDPGTLPDEEHAWTERGRLPVHPGPAGHRAIATEVAARVTLSP